MRRRCSSTQRSSCLTCQADAAGGFPGLKELGCVAICCGTRGGPSGGRPMCPMRSVHGRGPCAPPFKWGRFPWGRDFGGVGWVRLVGCVWLVCPAITWPLEPSMQGWEETRPGDVARAKHTPRTCPLEPWSTGAPPQVLTSGSEARELSQSATALCKSATIWTAVQTAETEAPSCLPACLPSSRRRRRK